MRERRSVRLRRLAALRERMLDARAAELARARGEMDDARRALEAKRACVQSAKDARDAVAKGARTPDEWRGAEAWLAAERTREERAMAVVAEARHAVEQARERVIAARTELKRIETLAERAGEQEAIEERRRERKQQDETAARATRRGAQ